MAIINATFESTDKADFAAARLRQKGIPFNVVPAYPLPDKVPTNGVNGSPAGPALFPGHTAPDCGAALYAANTIYPNAYGTNAMFGTSAVGTAWMPLLGGSQVLSGYGNSASPVSFGQQGFRFTVGSNKADEARAILKNSGAFDVSEQ
ncbi:MAG: hypothetical protein LBN97_01100 [Oscillospiraceae bacterium]|jgi:hypothetical protein|nr:hypothetical protein [Oscillospiraceae bacterium]